MSTPDTEKSTVSRRLFPEEPANNTLPKKEPVIKFDPEKLEEDRRIARERWNFDFETETPLEGNWEWEEVKPEVLQIGPRERQQRLSDEIERVQSEQETDIHSL